MFRPDGQLSQIDHHDPDGSVPRSVRVYDDAGRLAEDQWWWNDVLTRRLVHTYDAGGRPASAVTVDVDGTKHEAELSRYDDTGRKTKVVFLPVREGSGATCSTGSCDISYGVEGTDVSYPAPGATTCTTTYDADDRPMEVSFHDANHALVSRVVFSRDQEGRVLTERMEFASPSSLIGSTIDTDMPPDERAALIELLGTLFDAQTLSGATYAYDEKGRRVEIFRRMGRLGEEHVTVRYDDFDNPVENVTIDVSREMENGAVKSEETRVHRVRFEYRYDAHGNWTERIVWHRTEPNQDERRSNIVRRTITYYDQ